MRKRPIPFTRESACIRLPSLLLLDSPASKYC